MKSGIVTVLSKEFARFFGDKRLVVMTLLLPGILIYAVYSLMGTAMVGLFAPDADREPAIYAANLPDSTSELVRSAGIDIARIGSGEVEDAKERIRQREYDLVMVFPRDFDESVEAYDARTSEGPAPNIEMYFNSLEPNSLEAYQVMAALLDAYESSLANKFDVNRGIEGADMATAEELSASVISMMMPMLLMIFLYSGCVGLAPESIAGEKERGTIATLLVTPLKRSELAAGKILSLAVLSFLSGLFTALATILSLPQLMSGGAEELIDAGLSGIYSVTDYLFLAMVILTTILLLVSLISIISAFAKTVKEAGTAVMPLMVIVMLVGVSGMFGGAGEGTVFFFIPLFNSVQSMSGVFSRDYSMTNVIVACLSNLVYACIGGFVLTKMFNSEKVMFSK